LAGAEKNNLIKRRSKNSGFYSVKKLSLIFFLAPFPEGWEKIKSCAPLKVWGKRTGAADGGVLIGS
jgi:hypothetical protein